VVSWAVRDPDAAFVDPRLAGLYDVFDADRSDLDLYVAIAAEVQARSVTLHQAVARPVRRLSRVVTDSPISDIMSS
jgi:hypothetical protein